jgi:hypothetical protein
MVLQQKEGLSQFSYTIFDERWKLFSMFNPWKLKLLLRSSKCLKLIYVFEYSLIILICIWIRTHIYKKLLLQINIRRHFFSKFLFRENESMDSKSWWINFNPNE